MKHNLIFILLGVGTMLLGQQLLDTSTNIQVNGFIMQGRTPDNKMDWSLSGKQADLTDSITDLTDFQLDMMDKDNKVYRVRSHHCRYMNALREVKSTSPVYFWGGKLRGTGIGYDLFLDTHLLRIRSHVKVDIEIPRSSGDGLTQTKHKEGAK